VITVAAAILLAASAVFAPRLSSWIHSGVEKGQYAAETVKEAYGMMTVLGDHPNDERLIIAIKDRDMPGRQMGIEYLGEGKHGDSIPVLEAIVRDPSERASHRVAALDSIYKIAAHKGIELAREFEGDSDLADLSRRILHEPDKLDEHPSRVKRLFDFFR
jgi:hypothetical protein